MLLNDDQIEQFHELGYVRIPNPFPEELLIRVKDRIAAINIEYQNDEWPEGSNPWACRFLLLKEIAIELVEAPEILECARQLLGTEDIHQGACGLMDKQLENERGLRQTLWHYDGSSDYSQVSFRTAFDLHDQGIGPLRLIPGSHKRDPADVRAELEANEPESDWDDDLMFAKYPNEIEVELDPAEMIIWTPNCWHATGLQTDPGPRRVMGWNYYPRIGRTRDKDAILKIFADEIPNWSDERKTLFGLIDQNVLN
ncbi:MAG: phytanoyl-CoA dioxygenase family protein [Lentisphaeria bacterium]|nr:phytanoyl-CoA dioxygenase family protein [Lentisphaeria bacterium]NQZ68245.1 phytanoyl-CoA dioxygenase family protein [Lentisphaeria bacterium]